MHRTVAGRWCCVLGIVALASCAGTSEKLAAKVEPPPTETPGKQPATRAARPAPVAVAMAPASSTQPVPAGARIRLQTVGEVFVPADLPRGLERVDLVVHFHGAPSVVEREFAAARLRAVLVTVNYGGLSARYEKPFSDPKLFGAVLDEALAGVKERGLVAPTATWRRVCVSSFSAGFGAVRAILKVPAYFDRIDALYLADTLYAGYVGEGAGRKVDAEDVKDFCRFAAEAAAGRKTLLVTHSYLEPGRYAGTQETADNLIAAAGTQRRAVNERGPAAMRILSRADKGQFHLWGCEGKTGEDHMGHLRNMRFWYPMLPVEGAGGRTGR
ncbi:MAG: hypothetical protein ACPMAQ_09410 [Phycisphaerae bacterium]